MNSNIELMNLYWTTSGVFPGEGDISRFEFKERVEAASRAGFAGIGIWHTDLVYTLGHMSLEEMRLILDDNGIKYVELEFLTDWFLTDERKVESDRIKRTLLEASQALQAKHIKIGDFESTACPMPQIIEAFASLCTEAEAYGATIAFEFMASAMIDNLVDSLTLVESAGASNGGLALDICHVVDLGIETEEIRNIPSQYLVSVELNDGALPGSPLHDPSRARRFCGEGDFDIKGFIECVKDTGYDGPWAVEVFSQELAKLSVEELNARSYRTTLDQFERT